MPVTPGPMIEPYHSTKHFVLQLRVLPPKLSSNKLSFFVQLCIQHIVNQHCSPKKQKKGGMQKVYDPLSVYALLVVVAASPHNPLRRGGEDPLEVWSLQLP